MRPAAMDDGWEARMAERTKARAIIREAEEATEFAASLEPGEDFDNAWHDRFSSSFEVGEMRIDMWPREPGQNEARDS